MIPFTIAGPESAPMRWRFAETSEEHARRAETIERIDGFWRDLATTIDELVARSPEQINAWMVERLHPIAPGICWELRPGRNPNVRGLVLTAEDNLGLRPRVVDLVARAPVIPGWDLFDQRMAVPLDDARVLVQARTGHDLAAWRVVPAVEHNRVNLTYVSPDPKHQDDADAWGAALCATQNLLGEQRTAQWIGGIRIVPATRRTALLRRTVPHPEAKGAVQLAELAGLVEEAIEGLLRTLPDRPLGATPEEEDSAGGVQLAGHLYRMSPAEAEDYPGQTDLFLGGTTEVRIVEAVRRAPFFSSSHSRCGETFCYVKLERADPTDNDLGPRRVLEEALTDGLDGVGAVTGGATGLRYAYIELALTDLDRSLETVRRVLRRAGVPNRSWILFHDAELACEWLGVYPDTPRPPA